MEAKLIKDKHIDNFYYLKIGINTYATTDKESFRVLSHKNCEAIANGYDLDELAEKACPDVISSAHSAYKAGFQKAVKLMGDKKFSEEDVILIAEYIRVASQSTPSVRTKDLFNEYQSLQQTEWDCIIEMEYNPINHASGLELTGHKLMDVAILENYKPKLDADGCIILKRK